MRETIYDWKPTKKEIIYQRDAQRGNIEENGEIISAS